MTDASRDRSTMAMALLFALAASAADTRLLTNPSFEEAGGKMPSLPRGWGVFSHDGGDYTVGRDNTTAAEGQWCLKVHGRAPVGRAGVSGNSAEILGPAVGYRLDFSFRGVDAKPDLVVRFRSAKDSKVEHGTQHFKLPYQGTDWQACSVRVRTPKAAFDTGCRIEIILYGRGKCVAQYDALGLSALHEWTPDPIDPAKAPKLELRLRPQQGQTVAQNPPDLAWPPCSDAESYVLRLSQNKALPDGQTISIDKLELNLYNHYETLGTGQWWWRYGAADKDGAIVSWSPIMSFTVPADATALPLPEIEELRARVPKHPRIMVTPDTLEAFRQRIKAAPGQGWSQFLARLEREKKRELLAEPPNVGRNQEKDANRQTFPMATAARDLAFGYLITGDRAYAQGAKRFIFHLCSWNPNGGTSYRQGDQSFRKILIDLAYCWDWMRNTFTPDERAKILECIRVRGEYLYKRFHDRGIHRRPYDSHGITAFGYFMHVTLAVVGDMPEAEDWFRYMVPAYWNIIPPWGAEDGGWCQGAAYWRYSNGGALEASQALRSVLGLEITKKPWFQNNGYFGLYCVPPFLPRMHFGDGNRGRPGYGAKLKVARHAKEQQNPYLQWYAMAEPSRWSYSSWTTLFCVDWDLKPKPPVDIPQSKHFRDIGWVAMHEALWDPAEVMLFFKSSWFGSFNHSHADQNHFVLNAFGEALAIDSGYYYHYGCPHDKGVARQTKYHNDVLVGGKGQPIFDINASGEIRRFCHSLHFDYAVGDAAQAYRGRLKRFERHIMFVRPDYFLVFDDLQAAQADKFTWCLHALDKMRLHGAKQRVDIDRRDAHLMVRFVEPRGLTFEQDDVFDVPTTDPEQYPNQWHLYATPPQPAERQTFLTALVPYRTRDAERLPQVRPIRVEGRHAVEVAWPDGRLDLAAFADRDQPPGAFRLGDFTVDARAAAVRLSKEGQPVAMFATGLRSLAGPQRPMLEASDPCTLSMGEVHGGVDVCVDSAADVDVAFRCSFRPSILLMDGQRAKADQWSYDADKNLVRAKVGKGPHRLHAAAASGQAAAPSGEVVVSTRGKVERCALQGYRRHDYGALLTGVLPAVPGPYRVDLARSRGYDVKFITASGGMSPDGVVWVSEGAQVSASSRVPSGACVVRLAALLTGETVQAPVVGESVAQAAGAILHESHELAEQRPDRARLYTHRKFLHGGSGLGNWQSAGHYVRWEIPVARAGAYNLVLKACTHEKNTQRVVKVNGQSAVPEGRAVAFAYTGGWGGEPEQWQHFLVPDAAGRPRAFQLEAGRAVIEMWCVAGLLNLDYLLLVPAQM